MVAMTDWKCSDLINWGERSEYDSHIFTKIDEKVNLAIKELRQQIEAAGYKFNIKNVEMCYKEKDKVELIYIVKGESILPMGLW